MEQFAHETINLLSLSQSARKKFGEKAREQIKVNYALEKVAFRFREIYRIIRERIS